MRKKITQLLKSHYILKMEKASARLCRLLPYEAKVELDFKSVGISKPKVHSRALYLNPKDDGLSAELYAWGFREPKNVYLLHEFILNESENIDTIIDIGSNIGYFPLLELASGAQSIIAIEPVPETYAFLQENMKLFAQKVSTLNLAISDRKECIRLFVSSKLNLTTTSAKAALWNSRAYGSSVKKVVEVPALPLEEIVNSEGLKGMNVVIRMDVEGFEETILKHYPKEVYAFSFELHPHLIGIESALAIVKNLLKSGYKMYAITSGTFGLPYPLVKRIGVSRALLFLNMIDDKPRILLNPNFEMVRNLIKQGGCLHVFATKGDVISSR